MKTRIVHDKPAATAARTAEAVTPRTAGFAEPPAQTPVMVRIAGPAALLGGAGLVVTQVVQLARLDRSDPAAMLADPVYVANGVGQFAVFSLLAIVVVGIHQWQERRAGVLGAVGLIAALVGIVNLGGNYWFEAFASPWLSDAVPGYTDLEPSGTLPIGGLSSYLLFSVGWVVLAVAALRARVFPRAIGVALLVSGVLSFQTVQPPLGVPLGLALGWLGVWMIRHPQP